ncbi:Formylmethanofuran dehydrogenase subunit E domain-containing protein [Candidatus Magnetomoraceae bacterium gMMP-15]
MKRICLTLCIVLITAGFELVIAGNLPVEQLGEQVVNAALAKLNAKPTDINMACLTNAGNVKYQGQSTRILYDVIAKKTNISMGKGNLLIVHTKWSDDLWFAFVQKKSPQHLSLTYISLNDKGIHASEAMNVYVEKQQSFKPFEEVIGKKAFSIVTIANGWANNIPEDLMIGSLFHDHFCCGVFTGYFTARFIQKNIPLKDGEKYTYIGAPGWCQDDYLMHYFNLTPGKNGYFIMQYPWYRPWKTASQLYTNLGGIIIKFDQKKNIGKAYLLQFKWKEEDFKRFINMPDLKIDWHNMPWLHVWYNKFFLKYLDQPEYFISVLKVKELKNKNDFNALINLGANPLKEMLGQDETWCISTK